MEFFTPSNLINTQISVAVVGVGGTGSYLLSMLSQMNYLLRAISDDAVSLRVTAYDPDTVSPFNCGRQNFYMMDIGKNKAQVLTERLNMGWGTRWQWQAECYSPDWCRENVVFTCVDNIASRLDLGKRWRGKGSETLWIDGGNSATQGNVICGHLGLPDSETRLPNWFDLYGDIMQHEKDDATESCSHEQSILKQDFGINHFTALMMCQYLWRLLRHGKIAHHVQMFDMAEGELSSLQIDPQMWQTFNFHPDDALMH
jgi:PRTRC genetic system ThiF family protein